MKLTKAQSVFLAVIIPLTAITALSSIIAIKETYANNAYEAAFNEAKTDRKILISKIETLNKINSMYEISYKTGFSNCIKLNTEAACSKRINQITNHFSNEYNTNLLKLLAEQSGIVLSQHFATGKITAVSNTLEHDDEIAGLIKYYIRNISRDAQKSLAYETKNDAEKKFAIQDVLKLIEVELEKDSGGSPPAIGKAPNLMDTLVDSGKGLFNTASTTNNGNNEKELSNEEISKLMTTYNTAFKSVALDLTPFDKETGGKN